MDRGDKHGLGQFHIDTLNGAYGLHSPTKKSDCGDKLMMILKGKNVQEDKEHIQFGSLPQWEQKSSTWDGVLGNKNGGKLTYIPPTLVNGQPVVASAVGNPLYPDRLTETMERTTYARLCLEIDYECTYPKEVLVLLDQWKTTKVQVEYNWKPPRCSKCKTFGHSDAICPKTQPKKQKGRAIWIQKKEGQVDGGDLVEMKEGTSNASPNDREPLIAIVEQRTCNEQHENYEDSTKATQDEGWETPKRRHTCRAKGINQVRTMQMVHNQENEDYQGPCTRDTGQDHSSQCLKGVELGLGLEPPNLSV
ncbi:hypothetical protein FRX31_034407 [Thalictrum thalictroides]|uniref:DUF4283 domain-containing protein n=1 Tax=Thalictrum thalictroides TaxID=46969 RepID=A0A7J6UTV4_THATH|nr:hypothetical protein FRX31_034407 [Thalictrum thalictroides]